LIAHGRWFSPGTPASSTTKTGRHDIAEILLKVALNTINQINFIIFAYIFRLIVSYNLITFFCIDGDIKVMIKLKTRPYLIKKQIDAKYKILLKRIFSRFYLFLYSYIFRLIVLLYMG
jgi:hypothetical protein